MNETSAQVSLYPLRQERLSPEIEEALRIFRGHDLEVHPGPMSTLIFGENGTIFTALREVFVRAAEDGEVVMMVTLSNACPVNPLDDREKTRK